MTYVRFITLLMLAVLAPMLHAAPLPPVDRVAFAPADDAVLPLGARFVDERGREVQLRDFVRDHYAIVVPVYFGCSNLCSVVLRGVAASLRDSGLHAGVDVDVIAISIAPLETPALALAKKRELLAASPDAAGWHFLTGDDEEIGRVAHALGYRYAYVPAERQYAHASGIAIVAPDGRVVRVLYGVTFPPAALRDALETVPRLALAVPARRQVAEITSRAREASTNWLLCFHYDPQVGRYTFVAMNAVRLGGLLALAVLAVFAWRAWRHERRTSTPR